MAKTNIATESAGTKKVSGTSVYVGPSIKGVMVSRTIFPCSAEDALKLPEVVLALKQRPALAGLIVGANEFMDAEKQLKAQKGDLYKLYRKVSKGQDKKEDN